tara:strand:- start:96471 stop:97457 length:987 start_codon:yes stop_codon:yes gene_type:complete
VKKIIKVLLIGLGNISFKYDLKLSKNFILTHNRAFSLHPNFKIVGAVDNNKKIIFGFSKKYKIPTFDNVKDALNKLNPELIVVSTPTKTHLKLIKEIFLFHKPKYIVCEKPLGNNLLESFEIRELCEKNNSLLVVNYQRNSSIISEKIIKFIDKNKFKPPFKITTWYSKGLNNSASHFITLFNFLFGEITNCNLIKSSHNRLIKDDFELLFKLDYENCEVIFIPVDYKNFFYNSFEMICKNGKLIYENGGENVKWYPIDKKKVTYSNYKSLSKKFQILESDYYQSQFSFVNNLWRFIHGKKSMISLGSDAILTAKIIEDLKKQNNEKR